MRFVSGSILSGAQVMSIEQERNLTAVECDERAVALGRAAAALPDELEKGTCWSWRSAIATSPK
jgi:hypothetical protein